MSEETNLEAERSTSVERDQPPEVTPERPLADSVKDLESLELNNGTKVDMLLVLAGEKPATLWHMAENVYTPGLPPRSRDRAPFDAAVAWAQRSGLTHETAEEHISATAKNFTGKNGQLLRTDLARRGQSVDVEAEVAKSSEEDRLTLYVACDEVWLEKMKFADQQNDPELLGECYGFPPTAVEAFANEIKSTEPEDRTPEEHVFGTYMTSPDHAEAELATARRWAATVKELSPELYAAEMARVTG